MQAIFKLMISGGEPAPLLPVRHPGEPDWWADGQQQEPGFPLQQPKPACLEKGGQPVGLRIC